MPYTAQFVRYLDNDLETTARVTANKPGNTTVSWAPYNGTSQQLPANPLAGVVRNSRLVIIGHGDPGSTCIGAHQLSPQKLAEVVSAWLGGTKIKRISLHMCYGGGNRGTATGSNVDQYSIHPQNSFAYRFASYCGQLTDDVTARTDVVAGTYTESGASVTSFQRTVGGRRKAEGDKVVFTTQATGSLTAPANPSMQLVWRA